jgi:hypothetical protein
MAAVTMSAVYSAVLQHPGTSTLWTIVRTWSNFCLLLAYSGVGEIW